MPVAVDPAKVLQQGYPSEKDGGLTTLIGEWVTKNNNSLVETFWQGAGFEIWAQVELTKYINACLGNQKYATRKGDIYKNSQRSDIVIYDKPATIANASLIINGSLIHGIELKCRSYTATAADFRADIVGDYRKVTQNHLKDNIGDKARSMVVGINCGDNPNWNDELRSNDWHVWPIEGTWFTIYYRAGLL
jgi:hypothetical protein